MKIYRCDCYDADNGQLLSWHANKKAAEQHLAKFQKERNADACGPEGVHLVEIPTRKDGLIEWLNAYFTTDNG